MTLNESQLDFYVEDTGSTPFQKMKNNTEFLASKKIMQGNFIGPNVIFDSFEQQGLQYKVRTLTLNNIHSFSDIGRIRTMPQSTNQKQELNPIPPIDMQTPPSVNQTLD